MMQFKKEERLNGAQVDKALRSATTWDVLRLQREFDDERAEAKRRAQLERERLASRKRAERERLRAARESRVRNSECPSHLSLPLFLPPTRPFSLPPLSIPLFPSTPFLSFPSLSSPFSPPSFPSPFTLSLSRPLSLFI